ncbi:Hypothetical predicted protein [Cloeon dipterum]|uniref:Uncharacterized protein n=1 Tax=Cloeon dipterum TaxID=197152 RepID=A0A8S1DXX6_9INSE|nr:Hypothetical predicted protein [Cloeon dipterum]
MSFQKELCLICECPTADGAVLAVQVDKEKLQEWFLNVCGHELAEEIEDNELICYFCLWHAEFQFEEMADEALVWWNLDMDDAARELRKKYFGSLPEMSIQKALCFICEFPTADGSVLAFNVDKEKLQTWFLNICGHELAEEIDENDKICYFCLWHAEFQWKFDEMADENLVWWNLDLDDAARELRTNYFEGNVEQCWVQLEKIEIPKSAAGEERRKVEAEIRQRLWKCIYFQM